MAPQRLLDGLVALVTGGGSGFGEGIAHLFAEEGAKVVILDIGEEGGQKVATDITTAGHTAIFVKADVTKPADWRAAVDTALAKWGKVDILINNAGWTYRRKDSLEVTETEYDRVFDINVKGIYNSINAVLPHFLKQGHGSIINISSCITCVPTKGLLYYTATKGAVDLLTRGLAAEYSHRGIRVNGVSPSLGNTPLVSNFVGEEFTGEMAKAHATQAPVGRMVTPRDIAKGCLYFASPFFNDFQTGILLRVDGGQYC
ncbi:4-formylbenzenesulfonate dehydrogenase TsaC1/TsaC2 [Aspergillus pseudoustus]|uniref:4-formylbenzenesulfonate dehydrogenase TsaC1/TsaC2 n=1 Tax=Aspergillus pseudoustus TaxID=1810923 RepID=A0ABR4J6K2_9EURO